MTTHGVFGIITSAQNEVLLVRRNDVPSWDLPGGGLKPGESEHQGVQREVLEETGLSVVPENLVGRYIKTEFDDVQSVYRIRVEGGHLIDSGAETKKIRFFRFQKLPLNMIPLRRKQLKDAYQNCQNIQTEIRTNYFLALIEKHFSSVKSH